MQYMQELAEARIKSAMANGDLQDLPGQGKPLSLDDTTMVPEDMRVPLRILKNAGEVPPEVLLRAEINRIEQSPLSQNSNIKNRSMKLSLLKSTLAIQRQS